MLEAWRTNLRPEEFIVGLKGRFEVWMADLRADMGSGELRVKLKSEMSNLRAQRAKIRPETADLRL